MDSVQPEIGPDFISVHTVRTTALIAQWKNEDLERVAFLVQLGPTVSYLSLEELKEQ